MKDFAFASCSQLTRVVYGEGLEEIGKWAFCECISLHEILIPHSVKLVHDGAFGRSSQLTRVTLSEGLEEIGERAFVAFGRCSISTICAT
jgi:hypothetical protein